MDEMARVNHQPVDSEVIQLASTEEGVDPAVVSFFDVAYVRSEEDHSGYMSLAKERFEDRRKPRKVFLKRP